MSFCEKIQLCTTETHDEVLYTRKRKAWKLSKLELAYILVVVSDADIALHSTRRKALAYMQLHARRAALRASLTHIQGRVEQQEAHYIAS